MDEKVMSLLRDVVKELTDSGQHMEGLLYTQGEIVLWLEEIGRQDDAETIKGAKPFRLTGQDDGLVWVLSGSGFMDKDRLCDFKGS